MSSLLIPSTIPAENITIKPRSPHMEVFDPTTGQVWLHQWPVTAEQYKDFKPEPPYMKSGMGCSAMDVAYFLRSPGAAVDGPLETRMIGGLMWSRVARPVKFKGFNPGLAPTLVTVDKHHVIGFEAGTTIHSARLPDGQYYIQQTATASNSSNVDPEDWDMFTMVLDKPWTLSLCTPSVIYFFRNLRSFAGPFTVDQFPGTMRSAARAVAD